jgi:hypothetical protein
MEDREVVDGAEHDAASKADGPNRHDPPSQRSLAYTGGASKGAAGEDDTEKRRSEIGSVRAWGLEGKGVLLTEREDHSSRLRLVERATERLFHRRRESRRAFLPPPPPETFSPP